MDDTVNSADLAHDVACFIDEHKGLNTIALDLGEHCSFTDCFVISTVSSEGHMRGLYRNVREYLAEKKIDLMNKKKNIDDEGWLLIDCGNLVIHLMTDEKRQFYDLERLWFESVVLYQSSSKSS